ncbi:Peptidase family S58 [Streptomyces mirabilis]|uniref:Peptidase family S58 n=1 Tax=Streptomyces mirabilis TaxID=68239 RepID=A0A1I2RY31_9ACTN|nr:Peptidase family S58 [Streptomyces mirabilis]
MGHATRTGDGWLTGTTVVLEPEGGAVAAVDVRGGRPGAQETDAAGSAVEPGTGALHGELSQGRVSCPAQDFHRAVRLRLAEIAALSVFAEWMVPWRRSGADRLPRSI